MKVIPIILSGGAGVRLWPLSRKHFPKQFIPLLNDKSLFTQTFERIKPLQAESYIIVCNEAHRFMVLEEMRKMRIDNFELISEPVSRNTAPAIALAAHLVKEQFEDAAMLILTSDHYIGAKDNLVESIAPALTEPLADSFITFGIQPTYPETGYGYIQIADSTVPSNGLAEVLQFIEKPDLAKAKEYLQTTDYFWNSGMFLFKPDSYLSALQTYATEVAKSCQQAWSKRRVEDIVAKQLIRPDRQCFEQSPDISIDYAVMEKVDNIKLCPLDIHWSDLGSWQALADIKDGGEQTNQLLKGKVVSEDSDNNIIYADSRLVVTLGVKNHLIVEMNDVVLVADQSRHQEIKQLITKLKENGYEEGENHKKVYRPWGSYESMDQGENFQVKRIIVNPGQSLSLQSHRRRTEHWVVVKGRARVTLNDKVFDLEENESTYIPIGAKHRLENLDSQPLHLIEVQCGHYLGEDDIERYQDNYGRVND